MDLLFTGRWMEVEEAARWGLVTEIVPAASLMKRAHELADLLAAGPPLVFAAIKEVLRDSETRSFADALARVTQRRLPSIAKLYSSEDQLEGARAFAEKRPPVWKGR